MLFPHKFTTDVTIMLSRPLRANIASTTSHCIHLTKKNSDCGPLEGVLCCRAELLLLHTANTQVVLFPTPQSTQINTTTPKYLINETACISKYRRNLHLT